MFIKKKQKNINKIFINRISLSILGLVIIVLVSIPLAKNVSKQYRINEEIKELQQEIWNLENKNNNLNDLINYLESDQFTEEQARLNLNYKKEGENVAVIKNNSDLAHNQSDNPSASVNINKKTDKSNSNIVKWFHYFIK